MTATGLRPDQRFPSREPSPGRFPDFFVAGHAKCGTTALHEALSRHPAVRMSTPKEPNFLAPDLGRLFQPPRAPRLPADLAEYRALFAGVGDHQICGEASAFYLSSRVAATLMRAHNPDAKVIAVFREPASFLHSLFLQLRKDGIENARSLASALDLEEARARGRHLPRHSPRPQLLQYSQHVDYVAQLERYFAAFDREQVLVLVHDDWRDDGAAVLGCVHRFLGIAAQRVVEVPRRNQTVATRSVALDRTLRRALTSGSAPARTLRSAASVVPDRHKARVRHLVRAASRPPATTPDPALVRTLRRRFRPAVEGLSELIDRDLLSLWGYDA